MPAYGLIIALQEKDELRFLTNGMDAVGARAGSIMRMMRALLPAFEPRPPRFLLVIQHWDYIHFDTASIAYGRHRGQAPAVRLVPDGYFFDSNGYEELRRAHADGLLPAWSQRQDVVFWRGSATPTWGHQQWDGTPIQSLEQVPRVAMCLALKDHPNADAAIMAPWDFPLPPYEAYERLLALGIYRERIAMLRHADYRYLIDIDGYANAWSFFEKLLLGSCILKVTSRFEQWFYDEIAEWEHYVPIKPDLSDLAEKIEWCRVHDREAEAVGKRGQEFALRHTCKVAQERALRAIRDCCIPF
jgi:hypothetical protein